MRSILQNTVKRSRPDSPVASRTRSKRGRIETHISADSIVPVMATHTYNFMRSDTLVDWFKLQQRRGTRTSHVFRTSNGFTDFIREKGKEFETKIVEYIHTNIHPVTKVADTFSRENCEKTRECIFRGDPIIHSAPLYNTDNSTGGIADLLVRSDYINQLILQDPLSEIETTIPARLLGTKYHYVVVDIKFSTLPLRACGRLLLNSGNFPAYKSQILLYNQAIGNMQGYEPRYGFILGRRWKYTKSDITHECHFCLNKLGVIDYKGVDSDYVKKTSDAVDWVRNVKENSESWTAIPPSVEELYPNMCIDSGEWNSEKLKVANSIDDITMIWNCGIKHRKKAIENGVYSWRDKRCSSKLLGINGKRAPIIDSIISINRQNKDKVRPKKIKSNSMSWRDSSCPELFVDFETMSDIFADLDNLPSQSSTDMIFMIGVGWEEGGDWFYKTFSCNDSTLDEEYRIMDEYSRFVKSMISPKLWYWYAENYIWDRAERRQFERAESEEIKDNISNNWKMEGWCDLHRLFKEEPIVVKGSFKFGLKEIAKAMADNGLINTRLETECDSGLSAMVNAWKYYNGTGGDKNSRIITDISKYNEFDCKVLRDILVYLRSNH